MATRQRRRARRDLRGRLQGPLSGPTGSLIRVLRGISRALGSAERPILGAVTVLALLGAWEVYGSEFAANPQYVSSPGDVCIAAYKYFTDGPAVSDLYVTGKEFGIGFALSLVVGIPAGLCMGWFNRVGYMWSPIVTFMYAIPRIALAPVLVLYLGIGVSSKVAICFLGGVFPLIISSQAGIQTIPRDLLELGRSLRASSFQLLRTIVIPGSVPAIVAGVRLAIGQALIGVIVGELVASTSGVGYRMIAAANLFQTSLVFVTVTEMAIAGVVLTAIAGYAQRRVERWRL